MKIIRKLKQKAKQLKSEISVLAIAYTDKRTPFIARLAIGLTIGYLLSPIDLIPDFIPVLGLLDDLIIVPLLIMLSIKLIPKIVLDEARQKVENDPQRMKKNSRAFEVVFIIIWITLLYLLYKFLRRVIYS